MNRRQLFLDKAIIVFLYINIIQVITILLLIIFSGSIFYESDYSSYLYKFKFILLIFGILSVINVASSRKSLKLIRNSTMKISMQKESLKQVSELNNTLRAQRHDFLNNLQVVYSLIQLDEYDDAKEYIEEVYKDIKKVSKVMRTKDAAINALIQAKILDGESKNIDIELNISSTLEDLKIHSWELCRVLSNLIDNAIFELCKLKNNRKLIIDIHEELNYYVFVVKNNGNPIPKHIRERIFEANFTTKGDEGQGMGLAITKGIVEDNNGILDFTSNEEWTSFEVKIPINI